MSANDSNSGVIGARNTLRGSTGAQRGYVEIDISSDEEDFGLERFSEMDMPFFVNDTPTQVVYPTMRENAKRPTPNSTSSANKKAKTTLNDIEIIDLTDSPPKRQSRVVPFSSDDLYPSLSSPSVPITKRNVPAIDLDDFFQPVVPQKYNSPHLYQAAQAERYAALLTQKNPSTSPDPFQTTPSPEPLPQPAEGECSPEQTQILNLVSQGKNVFFTGSAGVGKSFVLQKICTLFKSQGLKQFCDFFITASTGIAAVHVGGMTVHSFAGCGKGEDGITELKKRIERNKRTRKHWKECQTLIIDEVSMLSDDLFDKLDEIGRYIRKSDLPFGGIQLILCGDFYQLPPVPPEKRRCPKCGGFNSNVKGEMLECTGRSDPKEAYSPLCKTTFPKKIGYIFQSKAWKRANLNIIELTRIYRQSDTSFVTALNNTRLGNPDIHTLKLFNQCQRPLKHDESIKPTKMYPIRALVQTENSKEFEALNTPIHIYSSIDTQSSMENTPDLTNVLNDLQATRGLRLRVGAQVMLLANLNVTEGLVNGSRGVVVEFVSLEEALLHIQLQATMRGTIGDEAVTELRLFTRGNDNMRFPKVLFETKDCTREIIITPYTWKVSLGYQLEVSRVQIPLMTAWALTIHKCQGMTLEKCVLHLERCFGFGMAYVALSRCKSLEGLQIVGWKGGKEIRADPVVQDFYKRIKAGGR